MVSSPLSRLFLTGPDNFWSHSGMKTQKWYNSWLLSQKVFPLQCQLDITFVELMGSHVTFFLEAFRKGKQVRRQLGLVRPKSSRKEGKKNKNTIYGYCSFFWNLEFQILLFYFFRIRLKRAQKKVRKWRKKSGISYNFFWNSTFFPISHISITQSRWKKFSKQNPKKALINLLL